MDSATSMKTLAKTMQRANQIIQIFHFTNVDVFLDTMELLATVNIALQLV